MSDEPPISRRRLFTLRGLGAALGGRPAPAADGPRVRRRAVIRARDCLDHHGRSSCSACIDRCPVPGAMRLEQGLAFVEADLCTGCGACRDACPAPRNAVLLVPNVLQGGLP